MPRAAIHPGTRTAAVPHLDQGRIARQWRRWAAVGALGLLLSGALLALAVGAFPGNAYYTLGLLLVIGAVLQAGHAALLPRHAGAGWPLLGSAAYLIAGVLLLGVAFDGALSPEVLIGITLMIGGLSRSFLAVVLEPLRGWYWLFAIGLLTVSAGLGLLLWVFEPSPGLVGLLVGAASALEAGWVLLTVWSARRRHSEQTLCLDPAPPGLSRRSCRAETPGRRRRLRRRD